MENNQNNKIENKEDEEDELIFVYPPYENFYCSICHELFKNPVITKECNHSFCYNCIFQIEKPYCPLCRTKVVFYEKKYFY